MTLLIDTMPLTFTLEEDASRPGKLVARGEFARTNVPTANKRLYKEGLWKREIGKLAEAMHDRRVYGEADHPGDGKTKLVRVSHLLTDLRIEGNQVVGEAEILDTPNGRILKAILQAGGKLGVSSRGYGSTKTLPDGVEEVQEDFTLNTFDFVADPAMRSAYPAIFHEETQRIQEAEVELTLDVLKKDYPALIEELGRELETQRPRGLTEDQVQSALTEAESRTERRLRERFAVDLRRQLEQIEESAYKRARSALLSDPTVAASQQIVEQIAGILTPFTVPVDTSKLLDERDEKIAQLEAKLAERELEVQAAQRQVVEMKALAKEAAYALKLERLIGADERADTIRTLVGNVANFSSASEIDDKVEAVRSELDKHAPVKPVSEDNSEREEMESKVADLEAKLQAVTEEAAAANLALEKSRDQAQRALSLAESLERALYTERKIGGRPDADKLRVMVESASSEEEIDARLEEALSQPRPGEDEAARIRARIARGKEASANTETVPPKNGSGARSILEGIGLGIEDFKRLTGG